MRVLRLLAALLVVAGSYLGLQSPRFRLSEVELRGLQQLSEQELLAWMALPTPVQLWQVDIAALERRLRQHPRLAGADVRRDWPNRLVVEVLERRAVAVLRYYDAWLVLDPDGLVIDLVTEPVPGVLRLEAPAPPDLRVGQAVPGQLRPAVRAAAYVHQYGLDWVEALRPDGSGGADLVLRGGVVAHLGDPDHLPVRKLGVLAALWEEWAPRADQLLAIDVRDPERPAVRVRS